MSETPAQNALAAAAIALIVACGSLALFLPPMLDSTLESVPRIVLVSLVLVTAQILHWAFLGIAARRLDRSVAGWVALSVLLFPIGSVAALILLAWLGEDRSLPTPAPAPRG
jgi:uncharacterized membrane protein YhaH (DUF805 family)